MAISDQIQEGIINLAEQSLNQTTPRSGGLRSLIIDPTQVDPQVDITGLRTATDTSPQLLAQAPDFQGVQFDPTSYDYIADLYELYSGGLPMLDTPATDTAQIPGAADTLVNVGGQGQGTGGITDPTLDTTFQDAGAVDVPGTIGTLGSLGETTTQIAPTVNILDEFGRDGNVYADVPPTTVNIPALDLSGTSTDLINQGVIETPSEFYDRTYRTSSGASSAPEGIGPTFDVDYESLDNEERAIVDQEYANAYNLAPVPEPATTLEDIINLSPTIQLGRAAIDLLTPDESVSEQLTIDPDTGLFEGGDPFVDAEENEFGNIQDTPPTVTTTDPINTALTLGEGQTFDDIGEIDTVGEQLGAGDILDDFEVSGAIAPGGAAQVFDTAFGSEDSGSNTSTSESTVDEADVEAGLATESISDFTPSPAPDAVTGDSGSSGGGGKIVCTMMNKTYGFGSFRNKIWLKQSKDLPLEYQKGYHILFLPLVKIAETNKIVRKILEHIAVHRTIDIRQESRGKTHMLGRIYRKILEPICYWVGKYAKR